MTSTPPRVLVTGLGHSGDDRGSRIVATYLRDAGMEVIVTGPLPEVAAVVNLALQEDVDVIGVSGLAADHRLAPKLMDALRAAGLGHVRVVVGDSAPGADARALEAAGVAAVYAPDAPREDIVDGVASLARTVRAESG